MQTYFYEFGGPKKLKITIPVTDALCRLWFDDVYTPWFDGNSDCIVPAIATDGHEPDGVSIVCENKVVTVECANAGHYNGVIAYFQDRKEAGQMVAVPFDMALAETITCTNEQGSEITGTKIKNSQTAKDCKFSSSIRNATENDISLQVWAVASGNMNYMAKGFNATLKANSQDIVVNRLQELFKIAH